MDNVSSETCFDQEIISFIFNRASKRLTHWILTKTAKISLIKLKIQAVNCQKVTEFTCNFHLSSSPQQQPFQFIAHFMSMFPFLSTVEFLFLCLSVHLFPTIFHLPVFLLSHQLQMNLFSHTPHSIYTNCHSLTSLPYNTTFLISRC